jgi:receptor protein-tyrosine kinase
MEGTSSELNIREPIAVLRAGLPIVALLTLLFGGLSLLRAEREESLYRSSASVFVATNSINSITGTVSLLSTDPQRVLATQSEVASLPVVARSAARVSTVPVNAGTLASETTIAPAAEADSLTFTVTDTDPEKAQAYANAYAQGYVRYRDRLAQQSEKAVKSKISALKEAGGAASDAAIADLLSGAGASDASSGNSTLGQPAGLGAQIQPTPTKDAFLGAVIGFILGIVLVFVRDALNTKVRTGEEIENRLGLPLLGRVPPPSRRGSEYQLDVISKPHSHQAEAYRLLATNIELINLDRGAKSIMVTSARSSEGKSLTTASLGVAFAQRGYRVAIVEADLRKPTMAKIFGLGEGPGLTDVIAGTASIQAAVTAVELPADAAIDASVPVRTNGHSSAARGHLQVLRAGPTPPAPAELLKSQAVTDLIAQAEEANDLVLIDTPPALHLSDVPALMLSGRIDAIMTAVKVRSTGRRTLDELKRVLESAPILKLGFFTTGSQDAAGGSRYGYGYGYGYGYRRATDRPRSIRNLRPRARA